MSKKHNIMVTGTADIRIIDMTQGELMELIEQAVRKSCKAMTIELESRMNAEPPESSRQYCGIKGLAEALCVSKVTAQRWKSLGYLEGGYQQIGNSIIVKDAQRLRDIAAKAIEKAKGAKRRNRVSYSIM